MDVTIVGWYGTETIGDRAILDGIFDVFCNLNIKKVYLGSLFPFYTHRTLYEEHDQYLRTNPNIEIQVFNIRNKAERNNCVRNSSLLIFGGGPINENPELDYILEAFTYASNLGIPRIIMGCGVEAISHDRYKKTVFDLFKLSSLISLRDYASKRAIDKLFNNGFEMAVLGDPALISARKFMIENGRDTDDYIVINLRELSFSTYGRQYKWKLKDFASFIENIYHFFRKNIVLVPMSTFLYDDRLVLNEIAFTCDFPISVVNVPQNLASTYKLYRNAYICVGMRHHSVVFETILNGKNIILDYTSMQDELGKTKAFLEYNSCLDEYEPFTIDLCQEPLSNYNFLFEKISRKVNVDVSSNITTMKDKYIKWITQII